MARYELLDEVDLPFPLGGCFGYWGYDLKNFIEPSLSRRAENDLALPDCQVGFFPSVVAFDHRLGKAWIIATGLDGDGSRSELRAQRQLDFWRRQLEGEPGLVARGARGDEREYQIDYDYESEDEDESSQDKRPAPIHTHAGHRIEAGGRVVSNLSRGEFLTLVQRAQAYIRSGDIYQVNLSQRLSVPLACSSWELFQRLNAASPAPFSALLDCGGFQIVSSSPEQFLRLSGSQVQTRPIKGTRPRSQDGTRDAQLAYELQTSAKETAELVMITDLLRNDLGRVCEYGSVHVPELARLERFPQVQHLVSTVEGCLRPGVTHFQALAACFPGGSITGAPKIRAMEIIDELEPIARGPYTGALGYLGFNRESQLSIVIRTAICARHTAYFYVGAGIVADSDPAAEYDETLAKARGFFEALRRQPLRAKPESPGRRVQSND
jgi:para-aminobenzoate synthetase component 1